LYHEASRLSSSRWNLRRDVDTLADAEQGEEGGRESGQRIHSLGRGSRPDRARRRSDVGDRDHDSYDETLELADVYGLISERSLLGQEDLHKVWRPFGPTARCDSVPPEGVLGSLDRSGRYRRGSDDAEQPEQLRRDPDPQGVGHAVHQASEEHSA